MSVVSVSVTDGFGTGATEAYNCSECGDPCDSLEGLRFHLTVDHLQWIPFVCVYCGVNKATEAALRQHLSGRHAAAKAKILVEPDESKAAELTRLLAKCTAAASSTPQRLDNSSTTIGSATENSVDADLLQSERNTSNCGFRSCKQEPLPEKICLCDGLDDDTEIKPNVATKLQGNQEQKEDCAQLRSSAQSCSPSPFHAETELREGEKAIEEHTTSLSVNATAGAEIHAPRETPGKQLTAVEHHLDHTHVDGNDSVTPRRHTAKRRRRHKRRRSSTAASTKAKSTTVAAASTDHAVSNYEEDHTTGEDLLSCCDQAAVTRCLGAVKNDAWITRESARFSRRQRVMQRGRLSAPPQDDMQGLTIDPADADEQSYDRPPVLSPMPRSSSSPEASVEQSPQIVTESTREKQATPSTREKQPSPSLISPSAKENEPPSGASASNSTGCTGTPVAQASLSAVVGGEPWTSAANAPTTAAGAARVMQSQLIRMTDGRYATLNYCSDGTCFINTNIAFL